MHFVYASETLDELCEDEEERAFATELTPSLILDALGEDKFSACNIVMAPFEIVTEKKVQECVLSD